MRDIDEAVREIEAAFSAIGYPDGFLAAYDQLECLGKRRGLETFLVRKKRDKRLFVAKCYDRSVYMATQETGILCALSHDGLPRFVDAFCNERMACTVRTYVEGTPLDRYVRDNALTRDAIVALCLRLCDILIYLHERTPPVIHRDIKPENIIVRADGSPVLIDFDTARTFKVGADNDTQFFGTRGYAAPEQYGFAQTDCRADVYSFGILLRFLLTGSIRENANVRVYRPLAKIIERCTAFAPKARYADLRAVKKALLAANPKARVRRAARIVLCGAAICGLLAFCGWKLYESLTFSPFTDGHIPLVMQDEARVADAISYLENKYGTHLFDETNEYMTIGILKDALVELYDMDEAYVRAKPTADVPMEDPDCFLPWGIGDEQCFDKEHMAYFVTKIYWPEVAADWTSIKKRPYNYPGILVSMPWCEKYGILTGVVRPYDITRNEAAIALANADRVYEALQAQGK